VDRPASQGVRRRIYALDGIRGLAALAVDAYHYLYRTRELYPAQLGSETSWIFGGRYGVRCSS